MGTNQAWKKHNKEIRPGIHITGKWHKNSYLIKKELGSGAIGTVYLCEWNGRTAALKVSDTSTSMTVEVNVLKSLEKVQGNPLGPSLVDIDDWTSPLGNQYTFYVMEYLQGQSLASFIRQQGKEWIGVFMLQLLEDLERLHQSGWIFGDLKTDNILVLHSPPRVRWIDVGGTTKIGRAIKEYTEFYDRGYWGLGTRRAEPSYDLFALVMVFLHVFYPKRFEKKQSSSQVFLINKINAVKELTPYRTVLRKAVEGKYQTSAEMRVEVINCMYHMQKMSRSRTNKNVQKSTSLPMLAEAGGITLLATMYYLLSLLL
ncbi:protein kinase domain-containing protein [Virgibacillus halodenitrificans]|uniref:protein kinase domain-containing protein n=1 Tax=Virgibacillus halodenitrificans TaxID=1482 RepID=UPI0007620833